MFLAYVYRHSVRCFSISRPVGSCLPAFDFLHPPVIRSAIKSTKLLDRHTRGYSDDSNDDEPIRSVKGWSASELARQDDLSRQEDDVFAEQVFSELDAIGETSSRFRQTLLSTGSKRPIETSTSPFVPHLESHVESILTGVEGNLSTIDTHDPSLSIRRQSALNALRAIVRDRMEGKQQQAIDIYHANELDDILDPSEKSLLASYLYQSTQRSHLEELLSLNPGSHIVIPTLCRLGRLEEATSLVLQKLSDSKFINFLEIHVVMHEYAKRKDWQTLVEIWEQAVMSPAVSDAAALISDYDRRLVLGNCLATIPNPKEWYITKATNIISDPHTPQKLVDFIRILGGIIVQGLAHANHDITALELAKHQIEEFGEISLNTLFRLIHSLRWNGRPKAALELYLSYRNNDFATIVRHSESDPETGRKTMLNIQNEAMASASALNNFPILKSIFEDIYALGLQPDSHSYAIVMHAFAQHGHAETVQELFDTFIKSGRKPDMHIFAELLYVHATLLDVPEVERTFKNIVELGLEPNLVVHDIFATVYSRTLNVDGAMRVFRDYVRLGNAPDVRLIGHLIAMFANRNDTDGAVEMFNLLREFGLNPNVLAYNQLLNAYANVGDRVNAEAVVAKMREVGIQPDVATWSTLLKLYVQLKEKDSVVDVLARMRRSGQEPDEVIWAQVIGAFAQQGGKDALKSCRRVLNRMKSMGIRPSVNHWNPILDATVTTTEDLVELQRAYDEMLDSGVKPNTATHAILVSAYCKYGGRPGLEVSEGIMRRLTSISQHLDLTSRVAPRTALSPNLFAPIFKVQARGLPLDQVQELFDNLINSTASVGGNPAEPQLQMLTTLIEAYRYHRDIEGVRRVWKAIKTHADNASRSFRSTNGQTANFVIPGNRYILCAPFSQYMHTLADAGELDELDVVWDQLSSEGYDFDCENWNIRIKLCLLHKKHIVWAFRACEEVLISGWEERLRMKRKRARNPPPFLRAKERNNMVSYANRIIWPIEADLMDLDPPKPFNWEKVVLPDLYLFGSTLYAFILLRRELLLGTSIVDSSGKRRPGPEVWERLKQAFPRIVRAMLLHLKNMSKSERKLVSLNFENEGVAPVDENKGQGKQETTGTE